MKILILGAGVIGTTYGWQLANAGHDVTLLVRKARLEAIARDGIHIRCRDERVKNSAPVEANFRPAVVDELNAQGGYDLIIVSVRAQQLDGVLPVLKSAVEAGCKADILFFGQNWWSDEKIRGMLPAGQYLFGFSRLVGGWRTRDGVECILFDNPELATMLGERDGNTTPRLQSLLTMFQQAGLKPVISQDILGWLAIHYVEFLGVVGGILKAGSYDAFVNNAALIKEAILATRESLAVCKARGVDFKKAAAANIRIIASAPVFTLVPLVQMQYRAPNIKQFFEENIRNGMAELSAQYCDVLAEGRRLKVDMPCLTQYEKYFA